MPMMMTAGTTHVGRSEGNEDGCEEGTTAGRRIRGRERTKSGSRKAAALAPGDAEDAAQVSGREGPKGLMGLPVIAFSKVARSLSVNEGIGAILDTGKVSWFYYAW